MKQRNTLSDLRNVHPFYAMNYVTQWNTQGKYAIFKGSCTDHTVSQLYFLDLLFQLIPSFYNYRWLNIRYNAGFCVNDQRYVILHSKFPNIWGESSNNSKSVNYLKDVTCRLQKFKVWLFQNVKGQTVKILQNYPKFEILFFYIVIFTKLIFVQTSIKPFWSEIM